VRPKKFDGSFPTAEDVNEAQEKSEMHFTLSDPVHKIPHKIPPHKSKKRELKGKSGLKTYFRHDRL